MSGVRVECECGWSSSANTEVDGAIKAQRHSYGCYKETEVVTDDD